MSNYQSLVERVLTPVGKSGNDIIYLCPRCGDKSGHLYIDFTRGRYHCVRCSQVKGRDIRNLLRQLNIDLSFDYESIDSSEYSKKLDDLLSKDPIVKKEFVDYSVNLDTLTKYLCYHIKDLSDVARSYLLSRGLTNELIDSYCIKEGTNQYGNRFIINGREYVGRNYSGRVIIPSLRKDGLISFYVARDYVGNQEPKYLNPPKDLAYSSEDVWNLDTLETDSVVICEGVMTAISVCKALNKNIAVATYGKSIADKSNSDNENIQVTSQGEKLLRKRFKNYIIFYDKDAIESALNTCKYLYERGANVRLVRIDTDKYGPKADANDMTREEIINYISTSEVYSKFSHLDILG